jgi:hypothetical protein
MTLFGDLDAPFVPILWQELFQLLRMERAFTLPNASSHCQYLFHHQHNDEDQ